MSKKVFTMLISVVFLFSCILAVEVTANAEEVTVVDELENFDKVSSKSDGWQVDPNDEEAGAMINKTGNNEVQYIAYKLNEISDFKLDILCFNLGLESDMCRPEEDIKVYISVDEFDWTEIEYKVSEPIKSNDRWTIYQLTPKTEVPKGNAFIKFELQKLNITDNASCYYTSITKAEISGTSVSEESVVSAESDDINSEESIDANSNNQSENTVNNTLSSELSDDNSKDEDEKSDYTVWYIIGGICVVLIVGSTIYFNVKKKKDD